jgi:hypothetical protein
VEDIIFLQEQSTNHCSVFVYNYMGASRPPNHCSVFVYNYMGTSRPPNHCSVFVYDYSLLNVERTVFQLYSEREKVQQYIKTNLHSSGRISFKIWHIK